MRPIDSFPAIWLHRQPVDGRKQIHGLAELVKSSLRMNPFEAALFAFVNKGRDSIRLLYWDRTGFAMWTKKLEREKFRWPVKMDGNAVNLSPSQLGWLLDGLDITTAKPHQTLTMEAVS